MDTAHNIVLGAMDTRTSLHHTLAFSLSHSSDSDISKLFACEFQAQRRSFLFTTFFEQNRCILFEFDNVCLLNDKFVTPCFSCNTKKCRWCRFVSHSTFGPMRHNPNHYYFSY